MRFPMATSNPMHIIRASRLLARLARDTDLVHTMALSALLPTTAVTMTVPLIHTEHWSGIVAPATVPAVMRLTMPLTLRLLRKPDLVVAVSDYLAERIRRRRSGPVVVVPNFVMTPERLTERREIRSTVRLVAVGGLIPRKGPEVAVEAVSLLRERGLDATLVWVGDGPMRAELEEQIRRLDLTEGVTITGVKDPEFVATALAQSDVFLLPTTNETFGVAIAEALAAGRPVVVGAEGGQAGFVVEPNGALVESKTALAFADAVVKVVEMNAGRSAGDIAASVSQFAESNRLDAYRNAYAEGVERASGDGTMPAV